MSAVRKKYRRQRKTRVNGEKPAEALPELAPVIETIKTKYPDLNRENFGIGSTILQ